jgi:hypothetical protein
MRRRTLIGWLAWAAALGMDIVGLGLMVGYANDVAACLVDGRLVLCSGPLAAWLMPVSVAIGLVLVGGAVVVGIGRQRAG